MSIVRYLTDMSWPGRIDLVIAARKKEDVIFRDELTYLTRRFPNLHVEVTLSNEESPAWTGARGRIDQALLRPLLPDPARALVYLCGPDAMMIAMRALLVELGVPEARILTEAFVSPVAADAAADDLGTASGAAGAANDSLAEGSEAATVRFERSKKSIEVRAGETILEAAESAGIDLPFECRSGLCGQCKTRLLRGKVTMEAEDALTAGDRARGVILACQARARGEVTLDA
jgi:ferredoxin-NADP reductase